MQNEPERVSRLAARPLPAWCQAALALLVCAAGVLGQTICADETATGYGTSNNPIRIDSNHIQTYGQSWTSGDYYYIWFPYEEAWQELNGSLITGGWVSWNNPNYVAESTWTNVLDAAGPGSYRDYSDHWFWPNCPGWTTWNIGYTTGNTLTITRPTISGVAAFWWLGNGVLSDNGYYAQSALTGNGNGASGSPYWSVQTVAGGGSVSLQCSLCTSNVATSTAPSAGAPNCKADVTIHTSYGGFNSDPFNVTIVAPWKLTLEGGYPADSSKSDGYSSLYLWDLTDTCGNGDPGLDGNEVFGAWTDDYFKSTGKHNNWTLPTAVHTYSATNKWTDTISAYPCAGGVPKCTNPHIPLSTVTVMHNTPWTFYFGTQTFGSGVPVERDTQQWYLDHGRHQ